MLLKGCGWSLPIEFTRSQRKMILIFEKSSTPLHPNTIITTKYSLSLSLFLSFPSSYIYFRCFSFHRSHIIHRIIHNITQDEKKIKRRNFNDEDDHKATKKITTNTHVEKQRAKKTNTCVCDALYMCAFVCVLDSIEAKRLNMDK